MDWKTFIVELMKAVAWPSVVVLVLSQFRESIANLMPRLEKFKHKDTEIEFSNSITRMETEISADEDVIAIAQTRPIGEQEQDKLLFKLAELSPRSAIIEAWRFLELSAIKAIARAYPDIPAPHLLNSKQMKGLMSDELLSEREYRDFEELRRLRNMAAHSENFDLSGRPAESYVDVALTMAHYLDSK